MGDGLEASTTSLAGPLFDIQRKRSLRTITMLRTAIEILEEKLRPTLKGIFIRRIFEYGPPHGPPTTRSQKPHDLGEGCRSIEPMEGCGSNSKVKRSVGQFCGLKGLGQMLNRLTQSSLALARRTAASHVSGSTAVTRQPCSNKRKVACPVPAPISKAFVAGLS